MKRSIAFILLIFILLVFASCAAPVNVPVKTVPREEPSVQAQEPSQSPEQTEAPRYTGPVVIAQQGDIMGGYSDGQWLSHSEAAALCGGAATFYEYNLAGLAGTAESSGVTADEEMEFVYVSVNGNHYEGGLYSLNIADPNAAGNYADDALSVSYQYTIPPQYMPEITVVMDTSPLLGVIQQKIDDNLGAGKAQAQIRAAISADIDNDGKQETIVNADNCADKMYDQVQNLYSIALIIESEGQVITVGEYYVPESVENQEPELMYIQNVIDLDGDGLCEIVADNNGWEAWWMEVYKYDGSSLTKVLSYGYGV